MSVARPRGVRNGRDPPDPLFRRPETSSAAGRRFFGGVGFDARDQVSVAVGTERLSGAASLRGARGMLVKSLIDDVRSPGPIAETPDQPPLFIIGSGRSGSTLMRRVLLASGQIYIPPETYVLGPVIETWPRMALLRWREKVRLFCAFFEKHRHFEKTFKMSNLNEFARLAENFEPERRRLRSLIDAFYVYLARAHGGATRRWGDKTPFNTHHLRAIGRAFRDAQYVWLVRDGRDVALSYVEAKFYPDLAAAADRWVGANAACAGFARRRENVLILRYEDLVSQPEAEFARFFDWAGLSFRRDMLGADAGFMGDVEWHAHHERVSAPISPSSVGRWRDRLTESELGALPPPFWRMMRDLGYAG